MKAFIEKFKQIHINCHRVHFIPKESSSFNLISLWVQASGAFYDS